jgi:hypothetical protein
MRMANQRDAIYHDTLTKALNVRDMQGTTWANLLYNLWQCEDLSVDERSALLATALDLKYTCKLLLDTK